MAAISACGVFQSPTPSERSNPRGRRVGECAPIVITTNRAYRHWAQIFNNDSTLTSAILDRVMHHVDTVVIEGKSFRMKDEVEL